MSDFTPHEAPAREAQALPVMLPGKLVGREGALAQVYAQLKEGKAVVLHGPAGVGKTALAATLGSAYTQQPGGVLWFNVNNPRLEELLVRVGRAYAVGEITNTDNPLGMIGAVENTLKHHKPLIVLDGRIDAGVAGRFISRCVTGLPAIIVSEVSMEGPWTAIELGKLEPELAALLFKQEARLTTSEHDLDVHGLVKLVNFMPLGIAVAARAMLASKQPPGDYFKVLQQVANATGGSSPVAALTASFRSLTGALQGILLMMGATFSGGASVELLSAISGAPLDSVQQAMNILSQLYLVERMQRHGTPYFRLHSTTHAVTHTWLSGSNRLEGLQDKVRDAIITYAKKYSADNPEAHVKLAIELDSFVAAARWAEAKGDRSTSNELVAAISQAGDFVTQYGFLYELLMLRQMAASSTSAFPAYGTQPVGLPIDEETFDEEFDEEDDDFIDEEFDEQDEFEAEQDEFGEEIFDDDQFLDELEEDEDEEEEEIAPLSSRLFSGFADEQEEFESGEVRVVPPSGPVDLSTGDINKLRSSLAQLRQSGDRSQQIQVLKKIGQLQVDQQMENEAIATYGEVLTLQETLGDEPGVLETLDMLSALMVKTENSQAAAMHAMRGVKLAETLEDRATRMQLLITLGDAHQQLGESDQAMQNYTQALIIARSSDDTQNEAIILLKLGYAHLDGGDAETAIDTWEQALALFRTQGKRDQEGRALAALGTAYGDQNQWSEAVNFYTSALYIAREVGNKTEEAQHLASLGYAAIQTHQLGEAVLRYRQALHLAFEADDSDQIVSTIVDLCRLLVESRKHLAIAQLLINTAVELAGSDKDVRQIKERIESEKALAEANNAVIAPVGGTARDYAQNAYALLEA